MSGLNDTPSGNRIHIAFFGLRNAGKSTLINKFCNQELSIVSATAGTTTDPVSKAMEILPLGPCVITDTAGLDDVGELGEKRVERTLAVLATTDIAVWVWGAAGESGGAVAASARAQFLDECKRRNVAVVEFHRGDEVEALKAKIASIRLQDATPGLLEGIVAAGDKVVLVCPIDASAPKGRLILPQVQVLRECLDRHLTAVVVQVEELAAALPGAKLVVTDSQAFKAVSKIVAAAGERVKLTSFSILFARQKGDLNEFLRGLSALKQLQDGDRVLIAEGCTHHRQCNDIGAVKIPRALEKLTGRKLEFEFASGGSFPECCPKLIVHCGGCMLTRREMLRRIELAKAAGVPILNYGLLLAEALMAPRRDERSGASPEKIKGSAAGFV